MSLGCVSLIFFFLAVVSDWLTFRPPADLTDAEIESIEEAGAKGPPSALTMRLRTIGNRALTLSIYAAMFFILCLIMA